MERTLPICLPSGDYVVSSLVNGPLGNVQIGGAMGRVPVIVPSPGGYPQKFHIELVDESNPIYVITVDGKNTRDDGRLVYAGDGEAQKWVITYWKQQDAYTITKLHTQEAWTEPDQGRCRDPNDPRQIRLGPVVAMNQGDRCRIHPSQLFRFKLLQGHKLPDGNYKIRSLFSNRLLGIQHAVGNRSDHPTVVPVAGAVPQTFSVQRVSRSEDTYLIRIEGRFARDQRNSFQSPLWVIHHKQQQDAYTITKLNTDRAWTEPDRYGRGSHRDPDSPRQIRLEPLYATNRGGYSDICDGDNQLFRFEPLLKFGHRSVNSGVQSPVSSRSDYPVVELFQTSPVQQVDKSEEDTYVVRVHRMHDGGERRHVYAFPNSPITLSVGPGLA